jgi:hypothetical protein
MALCSANPAAYRLWRIRHSNPVDVVFTWDVYRSPTGQNAFPTTASPKKGLRGQLTLFTLPRHWPALLPLSSQPQPPTLESHGEGAGG